MFEKLFSPGRIGKMEVPNRVVMTAMGNHLASNDGSMSEDTLSFYEARAKGGVGLIITECVIVDYDRGKGNMRQLAASDDKFIEGLKLLPRRVHAAGAKLVGQIYHPGRQGISPINSNLPMAAPSEVECQAVHQPVYAMSPPQIAEMVGRFAAAARRLKAAGFDGVEIHGAHGYLVNQFLSPYTNRRDDDYGGTPEKRMRFLEEIVAAVRRDCGPDFPLLVRLTVDEFLGAVGQPDQGLRLSDGVAIAKRLEALGVDAIDVSCGIYETMNVSWEPMSFKQGWKTHLAAAVKAAVSVPVIAVSVVRDPAFAEKLLADGTVDFVGSARQHYSDPQWSRKASSGNLKSLRRCISCLYCMQMLMEADITGADVGCSVNVVAGREKDLSALEPNGGGRAVAVIGAGPAGLEAARILALRKFRPVVFERRQRVGGQLAFAAAPPGKEKINWLTEYLTNELSAMGVEIRLGAEPAAADLRALDPVAIIVATGSVPLGPGMFAGTVGDPRIQTPWQVLEATSPPPGNRSVVVGSGLTGLETAHFLAAQGREVSVYEMADEIGPGIFFQNLIDTMTHLGERGAKLFPAHRLKSIQGGIATFERLPDGAAVEAPFDHLVLALGAKPENALAESLKGDFGNVIVVGDALKPGRIRHAVADGFMAARGL
ncbi:MAG: NAD(P)-binding protein [Deltaproteobacteria bacterium]|jgi:2,4-dienoyl-CoA reductase-like NADH-dependent reductase (Old Yellow Enzyme family)/thioredoxin reductase|nr:NAD(P)-binding protein [Deltaproteobacteria bacterium]